MVAKPTWLVTIVLCHLYMGPTNRGLMITTVTNHLA